MAQTLLTPVHRLQRRIGGHFHRTVGIGQARADQGEVFGGADLTQRGDGTAAKAVGPNGP
jgi:hypothetical protein